MKKNRIDLDQIFPFKEIQAGKRKDLEAMAETVELNSRQALYNTNAPSDKIFLVVSGGLKLMRKGPGRRTHVVDFVPPGTLIGHAEAVLGVPRSEKAAAMQPSVALAWPAAKFIDIMESHAAGVRAFNRQMARDIMGKIDIMEEQAIQNLRTRLIHLIHRLAKDFGQKTKNGTLINLKITHQDMADHLGASRESVTVTISSLRRQKLLKLDVRRIVVPDMRNLIKD